LDIVVATGNGTVDSLLNHQATENPHRVSFVYTKRIMTSWSLWQRLITMKLSCALGIHAYMKIRENTFVDIATDIMILYYDILLFFWIQEEQILEGK